MKRCSLPLLFLAIASAWSTVLFGAPPDSPEPAVPVESRSHFAGLDDVRLLATGLLQLGQSLREFVQKTKSQINDIFHKLNIFDRSFYQLLALASEIKEEEEELKKTTVVLKANNDEMKNLSLEINSKVDGILMERSQLQNKLGGLEERLSSLSQGLVTTEQLAEVTALKEVIHTQEHSITELLNAVRYQSDQINHQMNKIRSLEDKLTTNTFAQETIERTSETSEIFHSETPTLTPYVTVNSTDIIGFDNVVPYKADLPSDCTDLFGRGARVSGVYAIRPHRSEPFMVFCDLSKDGGSTVIQRRKDGLVTFDQTWVKYEEGFGNFEGEFWLGLKKIHLLAGSGNTSVLHLELEEWKQSKRTIEYSFSLEGPETNYTIHFAHPSGDPADIMTNQSGMMFSTKDRDNDRHPDFNCAYEYTGGWWFNACGDTNINGKYTSVRPKGRSERRRGIYWRPSRRTSSSLRFTQISIRHNSVVFQENSSSAHTSSETNSTTSNAD